MSKIDIHFPDNSRMTFDAGLTAGEILAAWKAEAARDAVAAKLNDRMIDLASPVTENGSIQAVDINTPEGVGVLRHSISHVMAEAVQQLFPNVKVTIGPSIEDGFYYDFDCESTFTPEDLKKIEKRMAEIAAKDEPFTRREVSREEAIELFEKKGEPYKVELIQDLPADVRTVSLYTQGDFTDLCRGPHIPATGKIKAFKLLNVAGAYWRGDEHNKMLQRIYGTGFATTEQMEEYLAFIEEAKRRDHRKLGRELDLFQINEEVGPGLIIWHPKGAMLRTIIEDWERKEHFKRGYDIVLGPQILRDHMWIRSGHMDHYKESMYFTEVEDQGYGIKPMNCLSHMMIYKSKIRSYRDLPLRYFELGTVHRHEKTGVLHGLMRARQFTQDDAHILCMPEQLNAEIRAIADFVAYAMKIFGFEYEVELSTRPSKSIGSDEDWDRATKALVDAMSQMELPYAINEGDGAFYGPKIDVKLRDCLGRQWQCSTIQVDFTLPDRFDLLYVGEDGERHRPVMVHRAIMGSVERFIGILTEHFAGAFPAWLAPVQARILTVTDNHDEFARTCQDALQRAGVRVELDLRNEKLGYKVREAQMEKIPYALVIGDQEVEQACVNVRMLGGNNLGAMPIDTFVDLLRQECEKPFKHGGMRYSFSC